MILITKENEKENAPLLKDVEKLYNAHFLSNERIDFKKFLSHVFHASSGFILMNDEKTRFFLALDVYALMHDERRTVLQLFYPYFLKKESLFYEMNYLYEKIVGNCRTNFFCITNEEVFYDNPFVDVLKDTCLNYNFTFILPKSKDNHNYLELNEKRQYVLDDEIFPYDQIKRIETKNILYFQIIRHKELLKFFDDNRKPYISMILPKSFSFLENKGTIIKLKGFKELAGMPYFIQDLGGEVEAMFYEKINFDDFYRLEHAINIFNVVEGTKIYNSYQCLLFFSQRATTNFYFPEVFKTERWNRLISDTYSCVPARYENYDRLFKYMPVAKNNFIMNQITTGLVFQENFEYGNSNMSDRKFKDRLRRVDLETVDVVLTEEIHYNYYEVSDIEAITEQPVFSIRILVTVDLVTHTAVLYLISLGGNSFPSKYLDMVSRNDIQIVLNEENYQMMEKNDYGSKISQMEFSDRVVDVCNLYDYLEVKFGIYKRGLPRNLILSPYLSTEECPLEGDSAEAKNFREYAAATLFSETVFDDEEELGRIIDDSIFGLFKKPYGEAIYDYSKVYISKTAVMQCGETFRDYAIERIDFAVVVLFYLEFITLEDAAIQIASTSISHFMSSYTVDGYMWQNHKKSHKKQRFSSKEVLDFLESVDEEYAKTLDFWDVQMNYASSKKALDAVRQRFELDKSIARMTRTRKQVFEIYKSRQSKRQGFTGYIIMILGTSLTINSFVETAYKELVERGFMKANIWLSSFLPVLVFACVFLVAYLLIPLFRILKTFIFRTKSVKK